MRKVSIDRPKAKANIFAVAIMVGRKTNRSAEGSGDLRACGQRNVDAFVALIGG